MLVLFCGGVLLHGQRTRVRGPHKHVRTFARSHCATIRGLRALALARLAVQHAHRHLHHHHTAPAALALQPCMRGALSGSVLGHASTSGASVSSTSSLHNLHHHAPRSPPHTASTRLHPRPLPAAPHAVMEPPVAPLSLAVAEPSQQGPQHLQQFVVSGTPPPSQQQQHHHQHDNGGCMLELLELEAGAPLSNAALVRGSPCCARPRHKLLACPALTTTPSAHTRSCRPPSPWSSSSAGPAAWARTRWCTC